MNISDATLSPTVQGIIASGALVTSTKGNISVLATHDTVGGAQSSGNASAGSAVNGLGAKITATGSAEVDSYIANGAVVSAAKTVTVKATGDNGATANETTPFAIGILANVSAIFATATADGNDNAYLGSADGSGGATVGTAAHKSGGLDVEATGSDGANATVSLNGGGIFSGQGGNATANANPTINTFVSNGSSVNVTGNVTVQSNSVTGGNAHTEGASGGIVNVAESLANTNVKPTITTYVGQATINAGGTITVDSVNGLPQNVSTGAFTYKQVNNNQISFVNQKTGAAQDTNLQTGDTVTFLENGNQPIGNSDQFNTGDPSNNWQPGDDPITGLGNGQVYSVIVVNPNTLELGASFQASLVNLQNDTLYFPTGFNLQSGEKVLYQTNGSPAIGGLTNGNYYYVDVVDATHIKLVANLNDLTNQFLLSNNGDYSPNNYFPFSVNVPFQVGDYVSYEPKTNVSEDQINTITANQINGSIISMGKDQNGNPISTDYRQGQELIYRVGQGGTPIGGLTPLVGAESQGAPHYYYAIVNGLPTGEFELSATYDPQTGQIGPAITLNTSGTTGYQIFTRADKEIGGLEYGQTYRIAGKDGSNLSLETLSGQIVHPFNQDGQSMRDEDGTIGVVGVHFTSPGAYREEYTTQIGNNNYPLMQISGTFIHTFQPSFFTLPGNGVVVYSPGNDSTPIGGLTQGQTYYVIVPNPNDPLDFELSATPGGAPITLNSTNLYGTQIFAVPSQQNLVIPLNNPNLVPVSTSPYELIGVGASANSPAGDGVAQAGSIGSGGGLVAITGSYSSVTVHPTVHTYVGTGANLTAGGDVSVSSTSTVNSTANGSSTGGGFVAVGHGSANITDINANSVDIDGSAVILAGGNFNLLATSNNNVLAWSNSSGGGVVPIESAHTTVYLVPQTEVSVAASAQVASQNFLTVVAETNTTAIANANGSGGGLGVNSSDEADIYQGQESVSDPSNFENLSNADQAYSKATIGGDLIGQNTIVDALTSYSLTAVSNAQAYAFGAESNATSATDTNDVALVTIQKGAKITGTNSVDIEARHDNAFLHANAQSGCHAAFGTANSYTYQDIINGNGAKAFAPYSQVLAQFGATIYTPNLLVQSLATFQNVWIENNTYGGFIVGHNDHINSDLKASRAINWNSDVVSEGGAANSLLIVKADGTIDPSSTIVPKIVGSQIIVPDISGASANGHITFVANKLTLAATPDGDYKQVNNHSGVGNITSGPAFPGQQGTDLGTFYFQQTTGPIKILNYSTMNLVVGNIDVVNRGSTTNNVTINVEADGVHSLLNPFSFFFPFHFHVAYAPAQPTLVDIENLTTKASPYILLQGTINNPIGTTKIINLQGDILTPTTPSGARPGVVTNVLDVEADQGQIGSGDTPGLAMQVDLVQSANATNTVLRPIQVTATAGTNAYLDFTGILRVPPYNQSTMTIPLKSIHAGNNVVVYMQDSIRESATGGGFGIRVYENYPNITTFTQSFFWPDNGPSNTADPGLFEGNTGGSEAFIDSVYNFQDVAAGHNITLTGQSVARTIAIVGNTNDNLNGPGTGYIDASTNGWIMLTETVGTMRAHDIQSTKGNVQLQSILNKPSTGQQNVNVVDGGLISALGIVNILASGGVEFPATSQIHAGTVVDIYGHYLNTVPPGVTMDILGKITAKQVGVYSHGNNDIINLARGQDTTPTDAGVRGSDDTVNVRNNGGALTVRDLFVTSGPNTFNISSTAGLAGNPPGVVSGIVGLVTVNGETSYTMNVSDTGDTLNQKTGLLTATTLTGLGMGQGIDYSRLANLNVYLGQGDDNFTITGINPPTKTLVDGGKGTNYVTAAFQQDFQGNLTLVDFQDGTVKVGRNFIGTLTDRTPGNLTSVTIGGSMTTTGQFTATGNVGTLMVGGIVNNRATPGNVAGHVNIGGNLNLGYLYGSLSGNVVVGSNVSEILEVFGNSSGSVTVGNNVNEFVVDGSQSGSFNAGGNVSDLEYEVGLTSSGTVGVGGNLFSMKAGSDASSASNGLFGTVTVVGNLFQLQTNGALAGSVTAGGNVGQSGFGGILVDGPFSGKLVVGKNVLGNLDFQGANTGTIIIEHHNAIPAAVAVGGSVGSNAATPSGGTSSTGGSITDVSGDNTATIDAVFADFVSQLIDEIESDLTVILGDLASLNAGSNGN